MKIIIGILSIAPLFGYTDRTVLRLAPGVNSISVCDSGSYAGGCYLQSLGIDASHRAHVWLSMAGFNNVADGDTTGTVDCTDEAAQGVSCSVLVNRDYGDYKIWVQPYLANDTSPGVMSSMLLIPSVEGPCETATFVVPTEFHGFENRMICKSFSIASGEDVSQAQLWMEIYNWRDGAVSIKVGSGSYVTFLDNPVMNNNCTAAGVCTVQTLNPHGFVQNQLAYFNGATATGPGIWMAQLNGPQTVTSVIDATHFTIADPVAACAGISCDLGAPDNTDNGVTVGPFAYVNEDRWFGGIRSVKHPMQIALPLINGQLTPGATNRWDLKFNRNNYPASGFAGNFGGYIIDWDILQQWIQITQIAVTSNTTATVTLSSPVPANWSNGNTVVIKDAPGPYWIFNGKRVISNISGNSFQFTITQPVHGSWTVPSGTYQVPVSKQTNIQTQPAMYAARALIPASSFRALNPAADYVTTGGNAANGATLFTTATLKQLNDFFPNHVSGAHCSSCHADNGMDIKLFSMPPVTQIVMSVERGLTEQNGKDIAAYIQSLATPYVGRVFNPPYQPGVGYDSVPLQNFAAGMGLEWEVVYDQDVRWFAVPGCVPTLNSGCVGGSYAKWAPGGDGSGGYINLREMPQSFAMPEWFRWLPTIAPEDEKYGLKDDLLASNAYADYTTYKGNTSRTTLTASLPANCTATTISLASGTNQATNDYLQLLDPTVANKFEYVQITSGAGTATPTVNRCQKGSAAQAWGGTEIVANFTKYAVTNGAFVNYFDDIKGQGYGLGGCCYIGAHRPESVFPNALCNGVNCAGYWYPSMFPDFLVSGYNWGLVKSWYLVNANYLYNMIDQVQNTIHAASPNARAAPQYTRGICCKWGFNRGFNKMIGGSSYLGNVAEKDTRFFSCDSVVWYDLPEILEAGDRWTGGDVEFDQNYYWAFLSNSNVACGGRIRPRFYTTALISAFLPQESWGWANLSQMTLNQLKQNHALLATMWYNDLFTPFAEEGEVLGQLAQIFYDIGGINNYNVAAWQAIYGGEINNTTVNARSGFALDGVGADELAYALTVYTFYGVSPTLLNNIVTWANSVWTGYTGAGGTFAKYTNATNVAADCTNQFLNNGAATVQCAAPLWP